jgi:CRISPR/Cas system-associated protein endoribonuclease Cas2
MDTNGSIRRQISNGYHNILVNRKFVLSIFSNVMRVIRKSNATHLKSIENIQMTNSREGNGKMI